MQATQQSKMIDQRKNDLLPTDFEAGGAEGIQEIGFEWLHYLLTIILYYVRRSKRNSFRRVRTRGI